MRFLKNGWSFKLHIIVSTIIVGIVVLSPVIGVFDELLFNQNAASSIGIIGGADGPTVIFLAGSINSMIITYFIVWIVLVALYIPIRHLQKH
ncbi:sodium ion-translocating decarboxylase subunit beta [Marinisporobacter balticus]|uniref:Na+-transporting oxaloacetate decarboxylase beta subunit n=1 Tax=Marinisporobacter balticus TaxID=2018667 RepID=A0A4R2KQP8_9FIRM|nr:sodium ion-translocating decarboxylase subunit beta [Marinisporobacter balticus]TCO75042.1 Na+-transporting oxaloacetate decarboxylase beta subunit [Marinisporobacter balticus]